MQIAALLAQKGTCRRAGACRVRILTSYCRRTLCATLCGGLRMAIDSTHFRTSLFHPSTIPETLCTPVEGSDGQGNSVGAARVKRRCAGNSSSLLRAVHSLHEPGRCTHRLRQIGCDPACYPKHARAVLQQTGRRQSSSSRHHHNCL